MSIDHELRDALRRKEAPADLSDRVLARINADMGATRQRPGSTGSNLRRWLAAAAVLAVAAGGAERYYTQQQAAEAARVKDEIRLALQITNETLARVQSKLSRPADNGVR